VSGVFEVLNSRIERLWKKYGLLLELIEIVLTLMASAIFFIFAIDGIIGFNELLNNYDLSAEYKVITLAGMVMSLNLIFLAYFFAFSVLIPWLKEVYRRRLGP